MSGRYIRAVLVGFCVAAVISGGLGFLAAASGRPIGSAQLLPGVIFGSIVAYALANLAGNRRSAAASPDVLAAARTMQPPRDGALVYAYRASFVGMAAGVDVAIDGQTLAQLKSPRFTCCTVEPGEHVLTGAFGGGARAQGAPASQVFTAEPGAVVAFRLDLTARNTVHIVRANGLDVLRSRLARMRMTAPEPPWTS